MTNFVETIKALITVHRDEHPKFPYDDIMGISALPKKGIMRFGYLTIEWERLGGEEVPEIGGGDN
jgi:hypothetical protein